jgi:hypothetical protein
MEAKANIKNRLRKTQKLRKGLKIERDILENECDFYEPTNPHLNPQ